MPFLTDTIGYLAAALTTAAFIPQAIMTIRTRDTSSISLSMCSLLNLGVLCWLVYGILIDNTAIILANAITFVLAASILAVKIYNSFTKSP